MDSDPEQNPDNQAPLHSHGPRSPLTGPEKIGIHPMGASDHGPRHNDELRIVNGDKVVIDKDSGLVWHQSGSLDILLNEEALYWLRDLNKRGYAGGSDWRLPSVDEGLALLEFTRMNGDLYIDPVFSRRQEWIWTSDGFAPEYFWVIRFALACKAPYSHIHRAFVRPVR